MDIFLISLGKGAEHCFFCKKKAFAHFGLSSSKKTLATSILILSSSDTCFSSDVEAIIKVLKLEPNQAVRLGKSGSRLKFGFLSLENRVSVSCERIERTEVQLGKLDKP